MIFFLLAGAGAMLEFVARRRESRGAGRAAPAAARRAAREIA